MHAHKSIPQSHAPLFRRCSPPKTDPRRRHRVACTTSMKQAGNSGESQSQHASSNHSATLAFSVPDGSACMAADSQPQQHLDGGRRLTERLRLAAWVLGMGMLLVWRFHFMRSAGAGIFASFTLSNSFNSASQTGALHSCICICIISDPVLLRRLLYDSWYSKFLACMYALHSSWFFGAGFGGAVRSAVAGFVAGLLHTLAGADHLAVSFCFAVFHIEVPFVEHGVADHFLMCVWDVSWPDGLKVRVACLLGRHSHH